jgi:flagellar hook protein FlgE
LGGLLNSDGEAGASGSVWLSQALTDGAVGPNATALTPLANLYDGATQLFAAGNETIAVSGIDKGDRELTTASFTVGVDGTTLGEFCDWLDQALGIQSGGGEPGTPGVTVVGGQIRVEGNYGESNDLEINSADMLSSGAVSQPFVMARDIAAANAGVATGTSQSTSAMIYDSLGSSVELNVTMVLETKSSSGNTWRFYIESPDDSDVDLAIGTGTVTFDSTGRPISNTGTNLSIDRTDTGALDPLAFSLNVENLNSQAGESELAIRAQDGFPAGTLEAFSIADSGMIVGIFSNGLTRDLGQIALANFANPAGLVARTNSLFITGPNSGDPVITGPMSMGAGRILSGALELSNVDLSREFIGLITASTGFSASSRVITTSDELLQELLLLTR